VVPVQHILQHVSPEEGLLGSPAASVRPAARRGDPPSPTASLLRRPPPLAATTSRSSRSSPSR
jgi:hypothetical protein